MFTILIIIVIDDEEKGCAAKTINFKSKDSSFTYSFENPQKSRNHF